MKTEATVMSVQQGDFIALKSLMAQSNFQNGKKAGKQASRIYFREMSCIRQSMLSCAASVKTNKTTMHAGNRREIVAQVA